MKNGKLFLKLSLWAIGIFALASIGVVGFFIMKPTVKSYSDRIPFESSQWKSHLEGQDPIKLNMVDDLLSNHKLIGMSIASIEELLGKPPQSGYFKDYDYVYWLGPERSALGVDSEWLGIKFQDGVVIKADVLRD